MTGGTVAMGIKVRATVNHVATGQPPLEEAPEETTTEQAPTGESEQSSPTPSQSFPVLPVAGIAAGTVIIITLIVVIARRYQY